MKKTSLVGEVGLSHEGSLGLAMSMAKACKDANLDYVKFQYHQPDFESTKNETFRVNVFPQDSSRYDYWLRTSFNENEWKILIEYCKEIKIEFLCTPFSVWAANQLVDFGIQHIKISSGDANNWELLEYAKNNFTKIIISVGMSTRAEVESLIEFMNDYRGDFHILQCTSAYPVKPKYVGMSYFQELKKLTGQVGLSDHSGNPLVSIAAIASHASMVEFHVVFDKNQFGPDSESSITFTDASLISQFRDLFIDLNDPVYDKNSMAEKLIEIREKFGRGLTLKKSLNKGDVVLPEHFTLKKPLGPLNWGDRVDLIGKRATKDIQSDVHLDIKDFE